MTDQAQTDKTPCLFLVSRDYVIGTPKGIASSNRTMDIPFYDFANNLGLMERLGLLPAVLLRPHWNPPLAYPSKGMELIKAAACYFAAFFGDRKEQEQKQNYLVNSGLVRILLTNNKLRKMEGDCSYGKR